MSPSFSHPPTARSYHAYFLDSDKYTPLIGKQCVGTMRKALSRKITGFTWIALTSNFAHFKAHDHPPTDSAYNTARTLCHNYIIIVGYLPSLETCHCLQPIFMHVTNNSGTPPPRGWALHWRRRRRWWCYTFRCHRSFCFALDCDLVQRSGCTAQTRTTHDQTKGSLKTFSDWGGELNYCEWSRRQLSSQF